MNPIVKSVRGLTTTTNGDLAYKTSGSACLDLFSRAGSARNVPEKELADLFYRAALEDVDVATRVMMWVRDCRGGAGERRAFRVMVRELDNWLVTKPNKEETVNRLIDAIVECGRYDDLFEINNFFDKVVERIVQDINDPSKRALVCKWLPREKSAKKAIAHRLMTHLQMTPRTYRKLCSGVVTTETLMCAKKWEAINLNQVPSVASARYQKAFGRNHPGYAEWKAGLETGKSKVNASVSFPHDILRMNSSGADREVVNSAWDALPNYIPVGVSILPIVDVSGSMSCSAGGNLTCMHISISLGAYIASKNEGPFKNMMLTFNTNPQFYTMTGKISDEFGKIARLDWGGSTDFQKSYRLLLNYAQRVNAKQEDLPQFLICLSDMQFDQSDRDGLTGIEAMKKEFAKFGYKMPKLIFWNLNAMYKNQPAQASTEDVMMVSGFSPAIMKATLSGNALNPVEAMLETVMVDRYKILD